MIQWVPYCRQNSQADFGLVLELAAHGDLRCFLRSSKQLTTKNQLRQRKQVDMDLSGQLEIASQVRQP